MSKEQAYIELHVGDPTLIGLSLVHLANFVPEGIETSLSIMEKMAALDYQEGESTPIWFDLSLKEVITILAALAFTGHEHPHLFSKCHSLTHRWSPSVVDKTTFTTMEVPAEYLAILSTMNMCATHNSTLALHGLSPN